ncbi:hypothetical protein J008_01891 [Cryptococcus neoformans]|nr:hypothetical protein AYX13_00039 [Cryptococcus neoformans var. grubii]OXG30192.1 hypothetical protein C367_01867 [Cryptococcus neoformans var. grubii Ze90-1]OXH38536.1 hypothetical protein J008_01891 [Cryptococcus neoformans var. grubii]
MSSDKSQVAPYGQSQATQYKAHPFHNKGDITLISSDGVLFKADVWCLAHASAVFHDMLEMSNPSMADTSTPESIPVPVKPPHPSEPIDIPFPSRTLQLFLDLSRVSDDVMLAITMEEAGDLLSFSHLYDLREFVLKKLKDRAMDLGRRRPWDLLVLASRLDLDDLGVSALEAMNEDTFVRGQKGSTSNFWESIALLQNGWQSRIIMSVIDKPEGGSVRRPGYPDDYSYKTGYVFKLRDWSEAGRRFRNTRLRDEQ